MKKNLKKLIIIFLILIGSFSRANSLEDKIKIGMLVPMTGDNREIGQLIIKAVRLAILDIDTNKLEIYPKDTNSNPEQTLKSAIELKEMGINIVIGPVFFDSLIYLDEISDITFLSLTNKTIDLPENVITSGVNATSQIIAIKKFIETNEMQKTIFLTPKVDYDQEIKKAIKKSKIKISKHYIYDTEPTKLTKQIEKITNYKIRKQNVLDEIKRIENSDMSDDEKERKIKRWEKRYTLGKLNFDSVIISDFDESLKSVITSLLYTDVLPENNYIITFNQWFDESLLVEKSIQPMYYPSINKKNLEAFEKKFQSQFSEKPNHLALLSYDLVGLVYYLSIKNNSTEFNKLFKKKNSFKGKIGIFDIQDNKINHRLNFYQIEKGKLKEIF